jgi:thiamine biosynthesis lipoprotein
MGTTIEVVLHREAAFDGAAAVRTIFEEWEGTLSRFRPESDLSRLNRQTGRLVAVSPLLGRVLGAALDAAQATDGLYDPTLLPHIVRLGYDRSFELLPPLNPSGTYAPRPGGGWRAVYLDSERLHVTMPAGVQVDLGGIAKGMAVDAALEHLREIGIGNALVNAGGDLAVLGAPPGLDAWPIAVAARTVPLRCGAMATSGTARRRWRQGTQLRHHILDPRTGLPSINGVWSVSVAAARCMQAEVATKTAFILGPEAGAGFLLSRGLAGMFVMESGEERTVGSWPARMEAGR